MSLRLGISLALAVSIAGAIAVGIGALGIGALGHGGDGPARSAVTPEVVGIRSGGSWAYVLQRGRSVALVDTGGDPSATAVLGELTARGLGADAVSAVFLTHGHGDHAAAVRAFPSATVYVGAGDYELVRGDRAPRAPVPRLLARLGPRQRAPSRMRVVLPGAVARVGELELEVISVPGHTPGSLMYLFGEVLFSGDGLLLEDGEVAVASRLFSQSPRDNRRALSRLQEVPFVILADGHAGVARDGRLRFERLRL